jgi:putative transposase
MADVTYIRVGGKWLYLAVVMDLFSRLAVGWELAPYQGALLSKQALGRALNRRRGMAPMIHHSDRGVEYANTDYQEILRSNGITCSMTRKGDCWGNAVMESFFSTLKTERTKKVRYRSEAQARADIADYIEGWYNTKRLHSALGYISPLNFEKRAAA